MRLSIVLGAIVLGSLLLSADLLAQAPPGGGGRPGGMMQGNAFVQAIDALGDLNLRPDFTLAKEQKEKLQVIREDVKKSEEQWRTAHAEDLKKIQTDMQAARDAQDQDKMREVMTQRQELMQGMPSGDDALTKVKALLTEDQVKALDTRITERQQEMRTRMGGMMGGGRRAPAGGGQ